MRRFILIKIKKPKAFGFILILNLPYLKVGRNVILISSL